VLHVSTASLKEGAFEFSSRQIDGEFSGKLAQDLKSIDGDWTQGTETTPITLRFSEEKPERE